MNRFHFERTQSKKDNEELTCLVNLTGGKELSPEVKAIIHKIRARGNGL